MDVQLDRSVIRALSNDTRVAILKELKKRRFTQTELAGGLGLSVPTVKEHLSALEGAGLVEMHDEGRKWKYFALTKKAKGIFEPEQVNIFLVLGTFILSVIGGVYTYVMSLPKALAGAFEAQDAVVTAASEEMMMAAERAPVVLEVPPPMPSFMSNYGFWIFVIIAMVSLALLMLFVVKRARIKRSLGKYLNKK